MTSINDCVAAAITFAVELSFIGKLTAVAQPFDTQSAKVGACAQEAGHDLFSVIYSLKSY